MPTTSKSVIPEVTPRFNPRLLRLPRVCVALIGATPTELAQKAEAVVRENPFIEFRLDYLSRPGSAFPILKSFLEFHPEAIAIATCRRVKSGGKFRGSIQSEVEILLKAADMGCQLVDLDIQSAKKLKPAELQKIRQKAALILSFHDFRSTRKLDETFAEMERIPSDYIKIISTATNLYDNVIMMKFLERTSEKRSMVGVCMGEQGIISRILGLRAGSQFTFASATPGEETAPGQVTGRTLRETYRVEQVDAATKVYGVVGDPVSHSLSPIMMNTALRRESINAVYLHLHAHTLKDLMNCVRAIPIHGLSITMPFKEGIMEYLDNTDPLSAKVGACNTVVRSQEGKLYGFNTDVFGVLRPLEQRITLENARVLVLGAGGAARAAVFGLRERNAQVFILNRTAGPAEKLARQAKAKIIQRSALKKLDFDVIINATPVGMDELPSKKNDDAPLNEHEIKARYLMEMIYNPIETRLVKMARAKGVHIISGVEMFVHQGARQFEIWTGKPAPFEEMYRVVLASLARRAAIAAALKNSSKRHK
ncbi:MAG TPA: shikimate dehydrogenase [Terriglobales bacterium]|nr:shikimate dehydrogenase [Terriglobales bacterium]